MFVSQTAGDIELRIAICGGGRHGPRSVSAAVVAARVTHAAYSQNRYVHIF